MRIKKAFWTAFKAKRMKTKKCMDVSGRNQVVRLINSSYVREDCCRSEPGKAGRGSA